MQGIFDQIFYRIVNVKFDNPSHTLYNSFAKLATMLIFFLILGLVFLVSSGIGLFYTNTHLAAWSTLWVFGNLTFGTFAFFGLAIIIFLAIFNAEFD